MLAPTHFPHIKLQIIHIVSKTENLAYIWASFINDCWVDNLFFRLRLLWWWGAFVWENDSFVILFSWGLCSLANAAGTGLIRALRELALRRLLSLALRDWSFLSTGPHQSTRYITLSSFKKLLLSYLRILFKVLIQVIISGCSYSFRIDAFENRIILINALYGCTKIFIQTKTFPSCLFVKCIPFRHKRHVLVF